MATGTAETSGTLLQRTRALLLESELSDNDIHEATHLHPAWLRLLRTGNVRDPGVNRIQQLYEFLASKQLKV